MIPMFARIGPPAIAEKARHNAPNRARNNTILFIYLKVFDFF
jgi:hypothetical protein